LLQEVTDKVIADDRQIYDVMLQGLQGSLKQAQQKLVDLDSQFGAKRDEIKNLARATDRVAKEATSLQEFIKHGSPVPKDNAGNGSIQKFIVENQMGDLNDQLKFSIPSQRIQLQNDLVQIEQQQWQQQLVVSQLETNLKLAVNTRQINPPSQSLYPVGTGRVVQVLLGTLVAVFFALLAVYIVVLLGNVRGKILNLR
jgi:predicted HNH restriction endonuclease